MENDILEKAIKAREEYLKNNPHLNDYQKEIDDILDKTRTEDRMSVISLMTTGKLLELQKKLMELNGMLVKNG